MYIYGVAAIIVIFKTIVFGFSMMYEVKITKRKGFLEEIRAKKDALSQIVQELTVKLYQQANQAGQAGEQTGSNTDANTSDKKNDDNVVDADFEEVNDDK